MVALARTHVITGDIVSHLQALVAVSLASERRAWCEFYRSGATIARWMAFWQLNDS